MFHRKPIFDEVRLLLGRGFTSHEVAALDRAIDEALASGRSPSETELTLGSAGRALIQKWEGCARRRADGLFEAYPDPGSKDGQPWTIGWGSTGPDIVSGTVWTQVQCDARFEREILRYVRDVIAAIDSAATSSRQFDALVSFHYNTGAIARATLTRKHIAGDHAGAAREFARWNRAGGRVLKGLIRRRAAEAELYLQ